MEDKDEITRLNFKGLFSYISTVISWTIFVLLMLIGVLLVYYYISLQLYKTKGEKFEPLFSIYTIISPSMEPNIKVMDAVVNVKVNNPDKIEVNDVITFKSTWKVNYGMTVTHRIVATQILDDGSRCFITRGDNNPGNDEGCVKSSNVIGVVKAVIPGLGNLQRFIASGIGWLTIIIIPAIYILIKDILKIFKLVKEEQEEDKKKNSKKSKDKDKNKIKLEQAYEDLSKIKSKKN